MLTEYDRWQYRQERAQRMAREELAKLTATPAEDVPPTVNWDAAFASILAPETGR